MAAFSSGGAHDDDQHRHLVSSASKIHLWGVCTMQRSPVFVAFENVRRVVVGILVM